MWKPLLAVTSLLSVLGIFSSASAGSSGVTNTTSTTAWVAPNKVNELDCNGWSSAYKSAKPAMRGLCTDPIQIKNGKAARFIDNGWYVGHDEPSVKFISKVPGSGNTMTYDMQVPVDPSGKAHGLRQRHRLWRIEHRPLVRLANVRPAVLSAKLVHSGQ